MKAAAPDSDLLSLIFRAVCAAENDAWCFVPIHGEYITHCSRSFLDAWELDVPVPDESGEVLPLAESPFTETLESLGLNRYTLLQFCRVASPSELSLPSHAELSKICRTTIFDDDQMPIGVMLTCQSRTNVNVPKEIWKRALQSREQLGILSPRESEILELVFQGTTNKSIGLIANISEKTVEKHRSNIMRKLGSRNLADLIRRVTEANMIAVDGPLYALSVQEVGS